MENLNLKNKINELESFFVTKNAELELFKNQLSEKREKINEINRESYNVTLARELLEHTSTEAREKGEAILEEAVSEVLKIVFGDSYSVKLKTSIRGGTPSTEVYVIKRIGLQNEMISLDNEGGGLKEVLSLAFFVTVSRLTSSENAALVVMDEPTGAVSGGHAESTAEAISILTEYLEKPSIIITHEREFLPNLVEHVFYVEQGIDGVSRVEEL
jgi:DNA repair exonuclease SbcCD ATPase subunit